MKNALPRISALATVLMVLLTAVPAVHAQEDEYEKKGTLRHSGGAEGASERGRERAAKKQNPVAAPLYPLATRVAPKSESSAKGGKILKKMIEQYDANDYAGVEATLPELAESTNPYERAFAFQLAANAAAGANDDAKAIGYFQKAVDANGLDNNGHYQVMYNLAVTQYQLDRYADALVTMNRLLEETKADKPEWLSLKAAMLSNLDRPAEASAIYDQLLAKNPNDRKTLMNAVALYQQADNFDKANALLADALKRGLLTEPKEYRALYVGYLNQDKIDEALKVIEQGTASGVIKPSPEMAKDYSYIGQVAYSNDKTALAIDMFKRAASMASDGEPSLNLAKVYVNEQRIGEAKAAAQVAITKGVKNPAEAKKILALPGK